MKDLRAVMPNSRIGWAKLSWWDFQIENADIYARCFLNGFGGDDEFRVAGEECHHDPTNNEGLRRCARCIHSSSRRGTIIVGACNSFCYCPGLTHRSRLGERGIYEPTVTQVSAVFDWLDAMVLDPRIHGIGFGAEK